ncbi:bacterial alpha-L-rhamnosidase-domain-containing protein [Aspergillus pseudodeflectus]|uniref:alpha-L-rhamnosidase n=1 Tax=Aspergillus pseudodeflectus TaxID=176178 RepID=A0ABR4JD80_9EURO
MHPLVSPSAPQFEHHTTGFGIGHASPRLYPDSWTQTTYELQIDYGTQQEQQTHHVKSDQSVLVAWPWEPLLSRKAARVRVRCYGRESTADEETATDWSEWSTVEASLLNQDDWSAAFITSTRTVDPTAPLAPIRFRKVFQIPRNCFPATKARLYITALDNCLAPGWTAYDHRLNFQTFDVTELLREEGDNVLAVEVGAGWYAGRLGADLGVLAQLENDTWECLPSAIQSSEINDGEVYDMRREDLTWTTSSSEGRDSIAASARVVPWPLERLEVAVVEVLTSPSGKVILDFGQNLVGKVRLSLTHAEVLEDGELCTRPLRTAKCRDVILGNGERLEDWTPAFTFHGFRYVQVDGWPGGHPLPDDFVALVMRTDLPRRGWFACSNSHVNRLHENIVWGMRGNFVSVPTDCPQRDERLGWPGDLQVFANTAAYLYNTTGMLSEWLQDLSVEHMEDHRGGIPPLTVPDVLQKAGGSFPQAVWGDAVIVVPDRQHKSMTAWLDQGIPRGPDGLWDPEKWQLGDWLDPTAPHDNPKDARTDGALVADAYLVQVTAALAEICKRIGLIADAERTFRPGGNIMSNTQTAIALAICFSLYQDIGQKRTAAASFSRLVRRGKFALTTGFVGTKFITEALTLTSQSSLAYRMLLHKKCPSWLYPLTQGATTIRERWDSIRPDGSINPGEMTSFNHYTLESVANWLHTSVGGIAPLEPGWKTIRIRPVVGGELQWAEARFDGPYGEIISRWEIHEAEFRLVVQIPPNSRAFVTLPTEQHTEISEEDEAGTWIGSGVHEFRCAYATAKEEWPLRPLLGPFEPDDPEDVWLDSSGKGQFTMDGLLARRGEP